MSADSPLHRHLDALFAALKGSLRLSRQQRRAQARRLARVSTAVSAPGQAPSNSGLGLHLLAATLAAIGTPAGLMANPQGAQVVQGSATFKADGKTLTVTNSNGAIINWQQFNIGAGETTRFVQPSVSSQVLNRVLGGNPSQILGSLQSNGQVFLVNPSGIVFGKGAQVDVGALAVSTLKLSDEDFKAGRMNFGALGAGGNPLAGTVRNEGTIRTASGGFVYLVAPQVENSGLIHSPEGQVLLAAGHKVSIVNPRTPEVSWEVSAPATNAVNLGEIVARQIVLHGQNVKNAGLLQATTAVVGEDGRIVLKAAKKVEQTPTGRMVAQGTSSTGGVRGGEIEISGAEQVSLQGRIEATGGAAAPLPASALALSTGAASAQTATAFTTSFGSTTGDSGLGYSPAGAAGPTGPTGSSASGHTGSPTGSTAAPALAPSATGPLNSGVLLVTGTGSASGAFPTDNTGQPSPDSATLAAHLHPSGDGGGSAGLAGATALTAGLTGPRASGTPAPAGPLPSPDAPLPRPDPRNALASGATGTGGRVRLIGRDVRLNEGLLIDVSAPAGGGTVLAGGELQGQRLGAFGTDQPNAQTLWMAPSAQVRADATAQGHGGTVILWADDTARIHGTLTARGGPLGGNGGFIETSSSQLHLDGVQVDTSALKGLTGTWLIDPTNIWIATDQATATAAGMAGTDSSASAGPSTFQASGSPADSLVTVSALQTALGSNNVVVTTVSAGPGAGDINLVSNLTWTANTTLTLTATRDININAVLTVGNSSSTSALVLDPGASGSVKVGFNTDGSFKGRVDFPGRSGTGFLTIDGLGYTVINALGAAGSTTGTDLQGMNGDRAGRYALGADINASATSGWNSGAGFLPVGNSAANFSGRFDGLGHTITGLSINRSTTQRVGLFGQTSSASDIRNVGLVGGTISGSLYTGGLVGVSSGTISNSFATGNVTGSNQYTGGLVGYQLGAMVSNSYAAGNVSGADSYTGGLVGYVGSGVVTNSYATSNVTSTPGFYTGGLVGELNSGSVSNSYATGNVASARYSGGLVGRSYGPISNSYATGNVSSTVFGSGGLVGQIGSSTVSNSYATGAVSGTSAGGLAGESYGTVTNSFWDTETSLQSSSAGGTGRTSAQMRDPTTFSSVGWSTSVWALESGALPTLQGLAAQCGFDVCWDGGAATTNWADAANWTRNIAPTSTSLVYLGSAANVALASSATVKGLRTVAVSGLSINAGGTLTVSGSGGTASSLGGSLTINAGSLAFQGAATLTGNGNMSSGTLGGTGTFTIAGALNVTGDVTLQGGTLITTGTSLLKSTPERAFILTNNATWINQGQLTVEDKHRIRFTGGSGQTNRLNNTGTLILDNERDSNEVIDRDGAGTAILNNSGLLRRIRNTTAEVQSTVNNTGTIQVEANTLRLVGSLTQSGLITTAASTTFRFDDDLTNSGTLAGAGTIRVGSGNTLTNNGLISPGGTGTAGTLTIDGSLVLGSSGTLGVKLGGITAGTSDVLSVTGSTSLGGTLALSTLGSFTPLSGQQFNVLTSEYSPTGAFASTSLTLPAGLAGTGAVSGSNYRFTISCLGVCWDGDTSFSWTDGLNWSGNVVPGNTSIVYIHAPVSVNLTGGTQEVAALNMVSGSSLNMSGTSSASLTINGTGGASNLGGIVTVGDNFTLGLQGNATLGGTLTVSTGTLNLTGTLNVPTGTLNLSSNHFTRSGAGRITPSSTGVVNIVGSLTTASLAGAFAGRTGGEVRLLAGGALNNANATLDIGSGGLFGTGGLTSVGGTILGGTLTSGDDTALVSNFGTLDGVTIGSNLTLGPGGTTQVYLRNTTTLANGITLNAGNRYLLFEPDASVVTPGTAALAMSGAELYLGYTSSSGGTLTVGSGITVRGYGAIYPYDSNSPTLLVNGTLQADTAGQTLLVNPGTLVNNGVLKVSAGTLAVAADTTLTQSGILEVASSSTFAKAGGFTNTGTIVGSGTVDVGSGTLTNNAVLRPGGAGTAGRLTVAGHVALGSSGTLELDVLGATTAGTHYDQLAVSGNVTLDGVVRFTEGTGFKTRFSDTLTALTHASVTGNFSAVTTNVSAGTAAFGVTVASANTTAALVSGTTTYNATGTTNWTDDVRWDRGIPTALADAVIGTGGTNTVQVTGNATAKTLGVTSGSTVDVTTADSNTGTLSVLGATTLGGTLKVSGSGRATLSGAVGSAGSGLVQVMNGG
ncbi:MAG: filamentous hemagglutinin N-terminal domain-containing protein, partial [Betaproteobacteria bacterium]